VLLFPASASAVRSATTIRVAILDLGNGSTASRAASEIRKNLSAETSVESALGKIDLIDRDQARAAAIGSGYKGSLNLELQQARDLGVAIGCEFYFIGDAQTVKRSPSAAASYFESFASVFLVSTRTGRLILWERPDVKGDSPEKSERALLAILASEETRNRYAAAIRRALDAQREERSSAEANQSKIEVMSDDDSDSNKDVRAPRAFRRLKPPYPEIAARAEAEATVDVLVDIDARGEVGRVEIVRWAGYGLDESVLETVRQMHFFPAMRNNLAIPMRVHLRFNFRKPPPQNS